VLVVTVVLAALGATSASLLQTPTYEATAEVLVGWKYEGPLEPFDPEPLMQPMIDTAGSGRVARGTIRRLGLKMTQAELQDNLLVEPIEGTSFVKLTYEDTDPVRAVRIVNTVGRVSSELISERSSDLTANVFEEAVVPDSPASPHPLRNGLLTLVIGLVLCAGAVAALPGVGARAAGTLGERPTRQGIGQAGVLGRDRSIVERVKEKKLLLALGRRGKLTAVEAALESELSVEEANRMLFDLAARGHLEVTVEDGKLLYSFWGEHGA
jgi:capsular polysaccharide biosynthesis protein